MPNFTPNDLLLYVLNEVDSDTRIAIERAIHTNSAVRREVTFLKQTIDEIDGFEMLPDPKIIDNLLENLHEDKKISIV